MNWVISFLFLAMTSFGAQQTEVLINGQYYWVRAGNFDEKGTPIYTPGDFQGTSGLIQIKKNGVWETIQQNNRIQYFTTAFEKLPIILETLMLDSDFLGGLTLNERKMLDALQKFLVNHQVELRFYIFQEYFNLNSGEVERTASTTPDPKSSILVNRLIISNPKSDIGFLDAVQLMVHEFGHKITKTSQSELDQLASKIKSALEKKVLKKEIPYWGHATILKSPLIVLFDNGKEVTDHSESLIKTINPRVTLLKYAYPEPYDRHKHIDSSFSVADVNFYMGPLNRPILRVSSYYLEKFITHHFYQSFASEIRSSSLTFESDIAFTENAERPFKVLSSKMPFSVDEVNVIGEIRSRWLDESRIEFSAKIPPSLRTEFPELLIENGKIFLRLKIQSMSADGIATWLMSVENNAIDVAALAQAVIVRRNVLVFSENGLLLKIPKNVDRKGKLILKSIQVSTTEPPQGVRMPAKTFIKLILKSAAPIKEVRLALARTWDTHSSDRVREPGVWGGQFENGYPHTPYSPAAYKTEVDFLTFSEGEFTQTRIGEFVEVEITREEFLHNISIDTGIYTHKISWFYKMRHRGKKYVGIDFGIRRILHVEAVNAAIEQVSTKWRTSVGYQLYKQRQCEAMLKEVESLKHAMQ